MKQTFRSLSDDQVGAAWQAVFAHGWPGWREWYRARESAEPATLDQCRRMLRRHLPGMERNWDDWVASVDGDEEVARFLSFWNPPRYLVNCSQVALVDSEGPLLIRNYDLDPRLNEATILKTAWHGHRVIGMVEGMAGLSDGMNDAGLALSLTFGGRVERGNGFGIPLIMRYVLETCRDVQDATAAFDAIPCHMSYNITMIDRSGQAATLYLSPDRPMISRAEPWATNHQLGVEWPGHGRLSRTVERDDFLRGLMADGAAVDSSSLARQFLVPPLQAREYRRGFGTVYTALYRPASGRAWLAWGDGAFHEWSFADFPNRQVSVEYSGQGSRATASAASTPDTSAQSADDPERIAALHHHLDSKDLDRWINRPLFATGM